MRTTRKRLKQRTREVGPSKKGLMSVSASFGVFISRVGRTHVLQCRTFGVKSDFIHHPLRSNTEGTSVILHESFLSDLCASVAMQSFPALHVPNSMLTLKEKHEGGKMDRTIKILGFAGSLRKNSFNKAVLRAAKEMVPDGMDLEIFDLEGMPLFNEDLEREPVAKVSAFKAKIRAADAILIVTPEYNYSIPGVLKNAIDCASRPYGDNAFAGKRVGLMGASIGMLGTARAQYHLRLPINQHLRHLALTNLRTSQGGDRAGRRSTGRIPFPSARHV